MLRTPPDGLLRNEATVDVRSTTLVAQHAQPGALSATFIGSISPAVSPRSSSIRMSASMNLAPRRFGPKRRPDVEGDIEDGLPKLDAFAASVSRCSGRGSCVIT